MKNIIIGAGEVGRGLYDIFSKVHETKLRDILSDVDGHFDIMHIAFPDHARFIGYVEQYRKQYTPDLVIVHSSVEVGTTDQLGPHVVYSPVRGRHPNLSTEMLVYPKFVAGRDMNDVDIACAFFEKCGWSVLMSSDPCQVETLKLLSNVHMGLEIAWRQEIKRMGVKPEMYDEWERSYRRGYVMLEQNDLIRPIMRPNPIGGHCILECMKLLEKSYKSKAFDFIVQSNQKAKEEHHETRHQNAVA